MRNYLISELKYHLPVTLSEVNLDKVLATGQVFRWRKECDTWFGVLRTRLWILRQDETHIHYTSHDIAPAAADTNANSELRDFLNLDHVLSDITAPWMLSDPHLARLVKSHSGLRLLRQDPHECLFAFITSSCNNIPRISSLLLKLSSLSPHHITLHDTPFHTLPTIDTLANHTSEQTLRDLGFGYRAKYIVSAARDVMSRGGETWLVSLRDLELGDVRRELSQLAGVGPKVASCVSLMSLDKHNAVPIDTHMFQVAVKYYGRPNKTLTPALHDTIEEFFQDQHGKYAGWAQAYLFYSNSRKEKDPPPGRTVSADKVGTGKVKEGKPATKRKTTIRVADENETEKQSNVNVPRTRSKVLKVS